MAQLKSYPDISFPTTVREGDDNTPGGYDQVYVSSTNTTTSTNQALHEPAAPSYCKINPYTVFVAPLDPRRIRNLSAHCDDDCQAHFSRCSPDCIAHCSPMVHVHPYCGNQRPSKIIVILLSLDEVIPPQYLCHDQSCSLADHHAAGLYAFRRYQAAGTVNAPPQYIIDAMQSLENGTGGEEERVNVGWFKYVHEGCDFAIKVVKEEFVEEEPPGWVPLHIANGRGEFDGMFGA